MWKEIVLLLLLNIALIQCNIVPLIELNIALSAILPVLRLNIAFSATVQSVYYTRACSGEVNSRSVPASFRLLFLGTRHW